MPLSQHRHRISQSRVVRIGVEIRDAGQPRFELPELARLRKDRRAEFAAQRNRHWRDTALVNVFQQAMQSQQSLARQTVGRPAAQTIFHLRSLRRLLHNDSQHDRSTKTITVSVERPNASRLRSAK